MPAICSTVCQEYETINNYKLFLNLIDKAFKIIYRLTQSHTISKSKMILRRLGGGDEAYCTYVEEADNDANKDSALI